MIGISESKQSKDTDQVLIKLAKIKLKKLEDFYEKNYDDYRACLIPLYQAAIRNNILKFSEQQKNN
jgi:hypothetical protein